MNNCCGRIFFHYFFRVRSFFSLSKNDVVDVIALIFSDFSICYETINIIFISDRKMLTLNRQFLSHDYFTDILTFFYQDKGEPVLSDIYISYQMITFNANQFNTTPEKECLRLCIHGALHLCGIPDKTKAQKQRMRALEDKYIGVLFPDVPRETM